MPTWRTGGVCALVLSSLLGGACGDGTDPATGSLGTANGATQTDGSGTSIGSGMSTSAQSGEASGAATSDGTTGTSGGMAGSSGTGTGAGASSSSGATTGAGGGPSFGQSNFGSVTEMFDYVNMERQGYAPHDRYRGFPFQGEYHQMTTWPLVLEWDDAAAELAQAEADAVAGGAAPSGQPTFANPGVEPIYVSGVNTDTYMVSGVERPGLFETETCTLCNSNPFMRMAVYYHDPGGAGPVLTRIGIGAADMGNGNTWWVFRFAP